MIEKNDVFDKLFQGKSVDSLNENKQKAILRFGQIMVAEHFHWTESDINNTSQEFFEDCVLYIQKKNFFEEKKRRDNKNNPHAKM